MDSKKRILIADDEAELRETLSFQLEELGYAVDAAENGQIALELVRKNKYQFVIIDLDMPVLNGVEFIKAVRKEFPLLPIGICSGKIGEFPDQLVSVASDGVLIKPFRKTDVQRIVENMSQLAYSWADLAPMHETLTVRDIMAHKVVFVEPDNTAATLINVMTTYKIGAVPVLEGDKIVGIVSERDLLEILTKYGEKWSSQKVSEIMCTDLVTITPDLTIEEAEMIMQDHHIRHLPVMENDKLIGIMSTRDIGSSRISSLKNTLQQQNEKIAKFQKVVVK